MYSRSPQTIIDKGHIEAIWDDSYLCLKYLEEIIKDPEVYDGWLEAGHAPGSLIIETYSQAQPMPKWVGAVTENWPEFHDFGCCLHKFRPGRYFPDHRDHYKKYRETFNVSIDDVVRILVYLEDWQPGQINTVEQQVFSGWSAGDWIAWSGSTVHSVVNFGNHVRYALAITCHR